MTLIGARDLTLAYGQKKVAEHLSFSLEEGQSVLICGQNGSGKSTLLRALAGLHAPAAGEIVYKEGVREGIGYLPQKASETLSFPATVWEVAASGLRRRTLWYTREQKASIREALQLFGADGFARDSFSALSGGQRQRVLLARSLLCATHVWMLDEPVTGLDPIVTHELYHVIRSLARSGLATLFVSHDVRGALSVCTHVLHLSEDGRAQFFTAARYEQSAHFCALCKDVHHA